MTVRVAEGREASPSAGVIDSQSVKTTESGGPRGYDAGKKIKGRKRHIHTDTCGYLVHAVIHTADIQDHDGAPLVLKAICKSFPWLRHVFADGGYAGDKLQGALVKIGTWTLEIIKRSDAAKGFVLLPRRCWGGRPPYDIKKCQSEFVSPQTKETARGTDYSHWNGYVKTSFPTARRECG